MSKANENILLLGKSEVAIEEFLQSVRKLIVYAENNADTKVDLWYCDISKRINKLKRHFNDEVLFLRILTNHLLFRLLLYKLII